MFIVLANELTAQLNKKLDAKVKEIKQLKDEIEKKR